MQALLFAPGEAPDMVEVESFEEALGGETEVLWPFENMDVCLVVLCEREDLEPNRDLYEILICGPFLAVGYHDDFCDLTEADALRVESLVSYTEEGDSPLEMPDPFEEDVQEEEPYGTVQIVDEETFYSSLKNTAENEEDL